MRQSCRNVEVLKNDAGLVLGISLGFDHVSEHEQGISFICNTLGVGKTPMSEEAKAEIKRQELERAIISLGSNFKLGLEGRLITATNDENTRLVEFPKKNSNEVDEVRLVCHRWVGMSPDLLRTEVRTPTRLSGEVDIAAAWDNEGFIIRAFSEEAQQAVWLIYENMVAGRVALGMGGGGAFGGAGPVLALADHIDDAVRSEMLHNDLDAVLLEKAVIRTNIRDKLKEAGRSYYALSARWLANLEHITKDSEYPLVFWLNPCQQNLYEYGWYTVEELIEWSEGRGPIMKDAAA